MGSVQTSVDWRSPPCEVVSSSLGLLVPTISQGTALNTKYC